MFPIQQTTDQGSQRLWHMGEHLYKIFAPSSAIPQPPNRHSYGTNFKILCGPALKFHQVFHLKVEVTETRTHEWLLVNGLICFCVHKLPCCSPARHNAPSAFYSRGVKRSQTQRRITRYCSHATCSAVI